MAATFLDSCSVIPIDYLERGQTIDADSCCATLTRLRETIRCKRQVMLSKSIILLYGKDRPHTAQTTQVGNLESPPTQPRIWPPMTIYCFRG
ncbi:hypothetical protein TNIN_129521 [Trichonephila inaurata madagascariensis]|uniref:Uncharacterized protein n=1 Tax=Trichonephila inaurata madagascariensis TaxID=2747483 RepID=A0A8X6WSY0_9ARAC|nr:hypothetical protein TNIN_129521 [Trichonephila inaurata madagascariensis]